MKLFDPYIPRTDGKLAIWATTYIEKLGQLGPGMRIHTEEIIKLQEEVQSLVDSIKHVNIKKAELQEAASAKRLLQKNVLKNVRNISKRIKISPAYTLNVGRELGIVSPGQPIDYGNLKPSLRTKSHTNHVRISFNKKRMLGVALYTRLKGVQEWTPLGTTKSSPFIDAMPLSKPGLAETREYRIRCYNGLEEI